MVLEKVQAIIADKLGVDLSSVTLESDLQKDFGADSLDAVEIIMAVEDEFDLAIDDEELLDIRTVGDIVEQIEKRLHAKGN
ncbi:MAG TPA: acyl carrier protein [Haloplasmataceae bacterium]